MRKKKEDCSAFHYEFLHSETPSSFSFFFNFLLVFLFFNNKTENAI